MIVEDVEILPSLRTLCAGFESGRWRQRELASSLFEWLPDFALTFSEKETFNSKTGVQQLRKAAHTVYSTEKYSRRGEFGELLLHMVLCEIFGTEPAVSKIYYKDGPNETVKGFDAVHAIWHDGELELWLGEVKFYGDLAAALRDIADELVKHFDDAYLRAEFGAVVNKVDSAWPNAAALKRSLHARVSLDEIRPRLHVPALVTYNSELLATHDCHTDEYVEEVAKQARGAWGSLGKQALPEDVTIHLILVPLKDKSEFVQELHEKLKSWQANL